ncbi:ornithine carbamoyltransferase [Hydrogenobaculum acidophilum]
MKGHFLDIFDISYEEAKRIVDLSFDFKYNNFNPKSLQNLNIALLFSKPSTRTRVSFEVGIRELGGNPIFLQESSLQVSRGEDASDSARTLSRYVDGVIIRTGSHQWLTEFAKYSNVPVINALTDYTHPCQALSDIFTLFEAFRENTKNIKVLYIGDGNNMANALISAFALFGLNLTVCTPKELTPDEGNLKRALEVAKQTGAKIILEEDPKKAVEDKDIIYTDVWISMNDDGSKEHKINLLKDYQLNEQLLSYAKKDVKIMHCLPAKKGQEITKDVFEKHADFIFNQAENRLHTQKALMYLMFDGTNKMASI